MNIPQGRPFDPLSVEPDPTPEDVALQHARDEMEQADSDFLATFSTPAGRRTFERMCNYANAHSGFDDGLGLLNGIASGFAQTGMKTLMLHVQNSMNRARDQRSK